MAKADDNAPPTFDFELSFAPDPTGASSNPASDAVSIFTALQEQLGLKLEATTGPVDMLVIDGAQRPTEN